LLEKDLSSLQGKFFLCSKHFADDQFYNQHKNTLLPNAIPTVFDTSQIDIVDSSSNEEPVNLSELPSAIRTEGAAGTYFSILTL